MNKLLIAPAQTGISVLREKLFIASHRPTLELLGLEDAAKSLIRMNLYALFDLSTSTYYLCAICTGSFELLNPHFSPQPCAERRPGPWTRPFRSGILQASHLGKDALPRELTFLRQVARTGHRRSDRAGALSGEVESSLTLPAARSLKSG